MRRRKVLRLLAAAPAIARPAAAQTDDWSKVVDAARKEGKVVMYSGAVGNTVSPKIAARPR